MSGSLPMEILGYVAAVLVGMVLGALGGGGSILSIPILVYLLHSYFGLPVWYRTCTSFGLLFIYCRHNQYGWGYS